MKISRRNSRRSALLAAVAASLATSLFGPAARQALASVDVWTDQSGDNTWNTTSIDWLVGGVAGTYTDGDAVVFNDSSGPGHYNVSVPGAVLPSFMLVNNSFGNYIFGVTGAIGGTGGLGKLGADNLTIAASAVNTYTGNTTLLQGTTILDYSFLATPIDLINASSSLVVGGGSLMTNTAATAASQTFNGLAVTSGASSIVVGGSSAMTLNLGTVVRSVGGTVDFNAAGAGGTINTLNANTNGILGGFATVAGSTWLVSGTPATPLTTYATTWTTSNTDNVDVTGALTPNADSTTNSLRFNTAGSFTVALSDTAANFNTIVSGGILVTAAVGANNNVISGGLLTSGNGQDLIVIQNNPQGLLGIGSQIVNNGATAIGFTESGPGSVLLTGPNTYTGVTTINGGVLSVLSLPLETAGGGTASGIGQSGNAVSNLVLNGGTLQYIGAGDITDRLMTFGPGGGTLDASGTGPVGFAGNGAGSANAVAFTQDTQEAITLTGSNTANNTFAPIIADPDASSNYSTSVIKNGAGTWILVNANTYSGGTTVNGGSLKINNTTGSGTGTGLVTVNAGATIGGSGTIGGSLLINSGGTLAPGGPNIFSVSGNLALAAGAAASYAFDVPNTPGPAGNNDVTMVGGNLNINPQLTVAVTPGANFNTGVYVITHYGSASDNSNGFNGWSANFTSLPANLAAGQYLTTAFQNDTVNSNLNFLVSISAVTPTLPNGGTTTIVVPANTTINNSAVNNPIVNILGGPGGNQGPGGGGNVGFFMARAGQPAAKGFTFGWVPVLFQLPPGTPYFVPAGVQVGDPAQTGIPVSPNPPFTTNPPFNSPFTGPVGNPAFGAIYPAGSIPIAAAPDDWLPAFFLAPMIIFRDPPATPVPTYYGESFSNPSGDVGVFLAAQVNGIYVPPSGLDTLPMGADVAFNYQGSFLSLVQTDFPGVTDLSQLTEAQWELFDGSFGVDNANLIAWSVNDIPDANLTVVAVGKSVPEPTTLAMLGVSALALLKRRSRRA